MKEYFEDSIDENESKIEFDTDDITNDKPENLNTTHDWSKYTEDDIKEYISGIKEKISLYKAIDRDVSKTKELASKFLKKLKKTEEGRRQASEKAASLNTNLMSSSIRYMKGKEKIRSTEEGQLRFNNALDSLALLSGFAPQTTEQITPIINYINGVRQAGETNPHHVRLIDYGEKRTKKAQEDKAKKYHQKNNSKNNTKNNSKNNSKNTITKNTM